MRGDLLDAAARILLAEALEPNVEGDTPATVTPSMGPLASAVAAAKRVVTAVYKLTPESLEVGHQLHREGAGVVRVDRPLPRLAIGERRG